MPQAHQLHIPEHIDIEAREAVARMEERHEAATDRIHRIEQLLPKIEADLDNIREEQAKQRLDQVRQYSDLRMQLTEVLPKVADAVPRWAAEEQAKKDSKRTLMWLAIGGVGTVLGALSAALALFMHGH